MKKLVVLISGNGSNLQAIIDSCHQKGGTEVVAVISNKADAYGLERAKLAGIDALVVPSKGIANRETYDNLLAGAIESFSPDLVVLAGFMRILSPGFVRDYQGKMLNIHPSLLPKYPGLDTHQQAIDAGDSEHGTSVHFVTEDLDSGPVALQAKVPVFNDDTVEKLGERIQTQEHQIYPLVIQWFCQGRLVMDDGGAYLDGALLPVAGYAAD